MVYIGAENIISNVGKTAEENFESITSGASCVKFYENKGGDDAGVFLGRIGEDQVSFTSLLLQSVDSALANIHSPDLIRSPKTLWILSSTKGDLNSDINDPFFPAISDVVKKFGLKNRPVCLSNACVSGVMAINMAGQYITSGRYDHVVVTGCDVISDFVTFGFQALFAMSNDVCRPFDKNRKGINLGEGAATVILSKEKNVFNQEPFVYMGGSSSNDANHISGPSRTGEGLKRSIEKTMTKANISDSEIDHILAHGTATLYNDEMEAIAFNRVGLEQVPVNSLKGFYGHTLGAAGVIETAIGLQSIRNNIMVSSFGFEEQGTTQEIAVLKENKSGPLETFLKTSSGFGGCNSTLIIQRS